MKHSAIVIIVCAVLVGGCGTGAPPKPQKPVTYPYTYIQSKSETAGSNENYMDLYEWSGEMNLDTLRMLCREKKEWFAEGSFYFLAVFDSSANAAFPTQPFTAQYGTDEEALRHIRAFYTYNRMNGYSKLDYYETNSWEGVAKSEDI